MKSKKILFYNRKIKAILLLILLNVPAIAVDQLDLTENTSNTSNSLVHLNTQYSQSEDLGNWQVMPYEMTNHVLINYIPHNQQANLRFVCKTFNLIISAEYAQTVSKLLSGKILINPLGWNGVYQFNKIEDSRVDSSHKGLELSTSEEFFLNAVFEAIKQNTIHMKVFSTSCSIPLKDFFTTSYGVPQQVQGLHKKHVCITTCRGVVPSFEKTYPPKDGIDPLSGIMYTTYGPTGYLTPLLVASFKEM